MHYSNVTAFARDLQAHLELAHESEPDDASVAVFPPSLHVLPLPVSAIAPHPHLALLHHLPHLPAHIPPDPPVLTLAISLAARQVAHLELIFASTSPKDWLAFPPDLVLTPIPYDPRLHLSLDLVRAPLAAWHPLRAVSLVADMARTLQAHLRAYHRAKVERLVAAHNPRVAFDLATAATASTEAQGTPLAVDAVYLPPAAIADPSSSSDATLAGLTLAATSTSAPTTHDQDCATVSLLVPIHLPLDSAARDALAIAPDSSPGALAMAVVVDHVLSPTDPARLVDVRVSHWLPEPWISRLRSSDDTPLRFPTYAHATEPLVDYLAKVRATLKAAVRAAATANGVRRQVVLGLARVFADCLIEADTSSYATLAVLLDQPATSPPSTPTAASHAVLATLVFPDQFPTDPPVLILRAPTVVVALAMASGSPTSPGTRMAKAVPEYTTRPKLWSVLRGPLGGPASEVVARVKGWMVEEAGAWMGRLGVAK